MPDDIAHLHEEFLIALHGEEEAKRILLMEHQFMENSRRSWRRLRCLLFGCRPKGLCEYGTLCSACAGYCKRCRQPVLPKARVDAGR